MHEMCLLNWRAYRVEEDYVQTNCILKTESNPESLHWLIPSYTEKYQVSGYHREEFRYWQPNRVTIHRFTLWIRKKKRKKNQRKPQKKPTNQTTKQVLTSVGSPGAPFGPPHIFIKISTVKPTPCGSASTCPSHLCSQLSPQHNSSSTDRAQEVNTF